MIYRFRIILDNDTEEDVFRDLEIRKDDTLEDLHNIITQAFGFDGNEMASFYLSDDEWNQGEEFSLFDLSDGLESVRLMNSITLDSILNSEQTKLIYVYDFFNMWTFFVELAEIVDEVEGVDYPNLMFVHGQIPDEVPERNFEAEDDLEDYDEFDDDFDLNDYDNLDFDENWN
ncbi:plasmid pRiA4b ORF-3 family protein [Formosa sediminum]|uniref:Plasmid pRiA4b ORF-3 family protein n=1 Tax=Formosa sediminum TaxID=2594004 RepID=A0A516GRG4_9FLAO|nr:plasmid pRiA4b ORF-3 family protein [Formosa sediminum]QDO93950.1 plasmid pRiA4b ORF-3 family protein [Formosa sediminum]